MIQKIFADVNTTAVHIVKSTKKIWNSFDGRIGFSRTFMILIDMSCLILKQVNSIFLFGGKFSEGRYIASKTVIRLDNNP